MTNPLKYKRRKSRRVMIGDIPLGDKEIIRIQSMTNTDTSNVEETAGQIIEILDAGADYVRVTVPTSYVAEKIPEIKQRLKARGKEVPVIKLKTGKKINLIKTNKTTIEKIHPLKLSSFHNKNQNLFKTLFISFLKLI